MSANVCGVGWSGFSFIVYGLWFIVYGRLSGDVSSESGAGDVGTRCALSVERGRWSGRCRDKACLVRPECDIYYCLVSLCLVSYVLLSCQLVSR